VAASRPLGVKVDPRDADIRVRNGRRTDGPGAADRRCPASREGGEGVRKRLYRLGYALTAISALVLVLGAGRKW
jgi:hypothetical protein